MKTACIKMLRNLLQGYIFCLLDRELQSIFRWNRTIFLYAHLL